MTEAELYRAAADVLRRDGWCRGTNMNYRGERCILGALDAIRAKPTMKALRRVTGGHGRRDVALFNDDDCRTINDAVAALEIAADLAS